MIVWGGGLGAGDLLVRLDQVVRLDFYGIAAFSLFWVVSLG